MTARNRRWYGKSLSCPELIVLIPRCGSRSIGGYKESGFEFSNVVGRVQVSRIVMNHETAVSNAKEIADRILAPTGDVLRDFVGKAILGLPLF